MLSGHLSWHLGSLAFLLLLPALLAISDLKLRRQLGRWVSRHTLLTVLYIAFTYTTIDLAARLVDLDGWIANAVALAVAVAPLLYAWRTKRPMSFELFERITLLLSLVLVGFLSYKTWQVVSRSSQFLTAEHLLTLFLIAGLLGLHQLFVNARPRSRDLEWDVLSGLFARPPIGDTLAASAILSILLWLGVHYWGEKLAWLGPLHARLFDRGIIPPICALLFIWGLVVLALKVPLLTRHSRALDHGDQRPAGEAGTTSSMQRFLRRLDALRQTPGETRDETLSRQIELLGGLSFQSYSMIRYFMWAIPILGFIGTVQGISQSVIEIGNVIGSGAGGDAIGQNLSSAMAPLYIAFDTTLIALSLSLVLVFIYTLIQGWEVRILHQIESRVVSCRETASKPPAVPAAVDPLEKIP